MSRRGRLQPARQRRAEARPSVCLENALRNLAGPTRLELATSGVTGQRSNQLNYDPAKKWAIQDSNL